MRSVRFARGHCRPRSKEVDISAECWYCGLRLKLKSALVEVRARQRVRLHCVVKPGKAARPDLTLSWFKNGTRLERGDRIRVKKGRLDIASARPEDAGDYVCRAERPRAERPRADRPRPEPLRCAEAKATVRVAPDPQPPTYKSILNLKDLHLNFNVNSMSGACQLE
ncbi:Inactive tyrosine-protein kinase 7, partial [Gryllus bimaculatus]